MRKEGRLYLYAELALEKVAYYMQDGSFTGQSDRHKKFEGIIKNCIDSLSEPSGPDLKAGILLPALCKNYGFHEEDEVRIVAVPADKELYDLLGGGPDDAFNQGKDVEFRTRGGLLIPYISIGFMHEETRPIKRIIVGPHADATRRRKAVEALVKQCKLDVEVLCSDIPYVG
ncbi:hypothetical protein ACZ75_10790 [Massilia sp. NR 4-1]|nr:hypothetical protein ACZ75_10790 [Massilia sp. NR 4-1]